MDAASVVEKNLRDQVYSSEDEIANYLTKKMNVVKLTDAERAQWVEATKPVIERFKKHAGKLGEEVIKAAKEDIKNAK